MISELTLDAAPEAYDFSSYKLWNRGADDRHYDLDAAYNMQTVNNADMLGFDNLHARAAAPTPADAVQAAHENPMDRLMAEYFLAKRGENIETNQMMKDLASVFEDPENAKSRSIEQLLELQRSTKAEDEPRLRAENMRAFMELDTITARAL